ETPSHRIEPVTTVPRDSGAAACGERVARAAAGWSDPNVASARTSTGTATSPARARHRSGRAVIVLSSSRPASGLRARSTRQVGHQLEELGWTGEQQGRDHALLPELELVADLVDRADEGDVLDHGGGDRGDGLVLAA